MVALALLDVVAEETQLRAERFDSSSSRMMVASGGTVEVQVDIHVSPAAVTLKKFVREKKKERKEARRAARTRIGRSNVDRMRMLRVSRASLLPTQAWRSFSRNLARVLLEAPGAAAIQATLQEVDVTEGCPPRRGCAQRC